MAAATDAGINFMGGSFKRGKHIVSWFDLEICSKVIKDSAIRQNTYDFLLVFYIVTLAVSLTISLPQSILCGNNLAG